MGVLRLFPFAGRFGPPILAVQQLPPAGNDRFLDSPPPAPLRFLVGSGPRAGPPILVRQQVFPPAGNDRTLDSPSPGPQRLLIGPRGRVGPPILLRQAGFFAEGSDRFVDAPLTHPLLKLRIGRGFGGPPAGSSRVIHFDPPAAAIELPNFHPLVRWKIGARGRSGPPILDEAEFAAFSISFPTQYPGLRVFYNAAIKELCLVAESDAPIAMGGVIKILKGGVKYAVYLVETTDPNASHVYVKTTTGIKALRLKT